MTSSRQNTGLTAAIGIAGAAGAAIVAGATYISGDTDVEICLKTDVAFIEGMSKGCYAKPELLALGDNAVLDSNGKEVTLSLSHPTDDLQGLAIARTCAKYDGLVGGKYYPLSSREIRRELYFKRACGALRLMTDANVPEETFFNGGAASQFDMDSLAKGPPFRMVESAIEDGLPSVLEKTKEGWWTLQTEGQVATLQEIAHADFNRDGFGDILTFVSIDVTDGSAQIGRLGLLQKASENSAVIFDDIE